MNITVFGANGKVGRLVVADALERGYKVVAFVHRQTNFPANSNLKIIKGDIYDLVSVDKALAGSDSVISCLGSWGTPKKDILSSAMKNIIPTMQKFGISRIVSLTGTGANAPSDQNSFFEKLNRRLLLWIAPKILRDSEAHIQHLAKSKLSWTVVRSPIMVSIGNPLKFSLTMKRPQPFAIIHRQAVARAMVDLSETKEFIRQSPFIGNK